MIRLFRVFVPLGTVALLISEIFLIVASFVVAAYAFAIEDPYYYLWYSSGIVNILMIATSMLVALYLQDLYSDIYTKSRLVLVLQLCVTVGAAMLTQSVISYVDRDLRMPLRVMVPGVMLAALALFGCRVFFSAYGFDLVSRDRLLLVGSSSVLTDIASYTERHPEKGLQIIGYLTDEHSPGELLPGGKVMGRVADLREVVAATMPSRVVIGMFQRRGSVPVMELLDLRFSGQIIEEAVSAYERICGRVCVRELRPSQLIYSGEMGPRRDDLVFHTISNLVLGTIGTVVALPLMAITALAVKLGSPGPMLYRQMRVGLDGVPFELYKFRSMRVDAEAATGAVFATEDDPRVTSVGRIIRKIRFDELPQLFNVVKGEMAIVGPRPERPEFVRTLSEQIPYYRQRHCVRPGITGWAQISYKYGDTIEDTVTKLEFDLYYIKNMSLSLDAYIIFHTVKAMLQARGAR